MLHRRTDRDAPITTTRTTRRRADPLTGQVDSAEVQKWAGELARNTQDVVAVVNRMEIQVPSLWNISLAQDSLSELWRDFLRHLPIILFALFVCW